MEFFFNELSIHNQFKSKDEFIKAVHLFRRYRNAITGTGFKMYLHRGILERPALGGVFRKGILTCFKGQQIRTLMNWFSKDGYFLPDDACADSESDRFTCHYPDGSEEGSEDVTGSALAECAFRSMAGEDAGSVSLGHSKFSWSPIKVSLSQSGDAIIENDYTLHALLQRLEGLQQPISSWTVLTSRIGRLPGVSLEPGVENRLTTNPFAQNVAQGVYVCAKALSEMATASSLDRFNELFTTYATGGKARFSDSSSTEKRDFKAALTFSVDHEKRMCPYHGKIKIQQYRIHLVDRPAFGRSSRIVYIGPKLTKG